MASVEVERMLRLAEQCLERAKSFIEKIPETPNRTISMSTASTCSPGQSGPPQTVVHPAATATDSGE